MNGLGPEMYFCRRCGQPAPICVHPFHLRSLMAEMKAAQVATRYALSKHSGNPDHDTTDFFHDS